MDFFSFVIGAILSGVAGLFVLMAAGAKNTDLQSEILALRAHISRLEAEEVIHVRRASNGKFVKPESVLPVDRTATR